MGQECGGSFSIIIKSLMIRIKFIVEGRTESSFISQLLAPYLLRKNIDCKPVSINGDIEFHKAFRNIRNAMKEDQNAYVSTMFDFYGISGKWPGKKDVEAYKKRCAKPRSIEMGEILNAKITEAVKEHWQDDRINMARFIPYFQVHEFEALVFCDQNILAERLGCNPNDAVFNGIEFNDPEMINGPDKIAPSYRIINIFRQKGESYNKVSTGINLAKKIGIETMRKKCPNFNSWLKELENLKPLS